MDNFSKCTITEENSTPLEHLWDISSSHSPNLLNQTTLQTVGKMDQEKNIVEGSINKIYPHVKDMNFILKEAELVLASKRRMSAGRAEETAEALHFKKLSSG